MSVSVFSFHYCQGKTKQSSSRFYLLALGPAALLCFPSFCPRYQFLSLYICKKPSYTLQIPPPLTPRPHCTADWYRGGQAQQPQDMADPTYISLNNSPTSTEVHNKVHALRLILWPWVPVWYPVQDFNKTWLPHFKLYTGIPQQTRIKALERATTPPSVDLITVDELKLTSNGPSQSA